MEAGTRITPEGWNLDDILEFIRVHGAQMETAVDGQIILYTNLYQDSTGGLSSYD